MKEEKKLRDARETIQKRQREEATVEGMKKWITRKQTKKARAALSTKFKIIAKIKRIPKKKENTSSMKLANHADRGKGKNFERQS